MAGKEKWTDPKVKAVFDTWKELLPFHQEGAAGRTWQDASTALVQKKAGDVLPRACSCRSSSRRPARPTSTTSTSSRTPTSGPQFDAEKALDAPIDGFMLTASRRPGDEHRRRQGVPRVPRPAGDAGRLGDARIRATSRRPRTPTRAATRALQKKAAELIGGAQRITQFLDRDTNPNFAGPNGMQAFLLDFLQNPDQDLHALHKKIQDFWDTL